MSSISTSKVEIQVFHRRLSNPLFLTLRHADETPFAGKWGILTGDVREFELPVNAALQTLVEKTALKPIAIWALDYIHSYYDHRTDTIYMCPSFAIEIENDKHTLDRVYYDSSRWITAAQAITLLNWPGQSEGLRRAAEDVVFASDRGAAFRINPHE